MSDPRCTPPPPLEGGGGIAGGPAGTSRWQGSCWDPGNRKLQVRILDDHGCALIR